MSDYAIFAEREREGCADETRANGYLRHFGPVVDVVAAELLTR